MWNTQLILIEGLGGSGKTTTVRYLEQVLLGKNLDVVAIVESDSCHPKFKFPNFVECYTSQMLEEWSLFFSERKGKDEVCLMEGHGWQPMAEFMYLAGYSQQSVLSFCEDVAAIIRPLNPVVVYYTHKDVVSHLERIEKLRGRQWISFMEGRDTRHHGLKKFGSSLLQFWREWAVLQDELFRRCSFPKERIQTPHDDWDVTYMKIRNFLQIE